MAAPAQNMFSDQEKEALAASVWIQNPSPDIFNKEIVDGTARMYIKGGSGEKIFGPKPVTKPLSVQQQSQEFQNQFAGKTIDDIYSSMMVRPPSSNDIRQKIGQEWGYLDKIEGVRQQAMDIRRSMLGDQSAIFGDPNLTPEDKKNQYDVNMKSYMERIAQLNQMETAYNSELETRVKVETDRAAQENERNKTVIDWFKQKTEQQNKDRQFGLEVAKFGEDRAQNSERNRLSWSQLEQSRTAQQQSNELWWANLTKPDKGTDPWTGETTYSSPYSAWTGGSGAENMKALASGKTADGTKFFGVYATADMDGSQRAAIYDTASAMGLDKFVSRYKGPVTSQMVQASAEKYGIDPIALAVTLAADSGMGSKGIGSRNNNPGNVGQFDSLWTTPVDWYKTLQEWIDATSENLKKRQDAMDKATGRAEQGWMSRTPFDSKGVGEALKELGIKGEITADKSKIAYSMAKEKWWNAAQTVEFVKKQQKESSGTEAEKFDSYLKQTVGEFSKAGDYDINAVVKKIRKDHPAKFTENADEKIREMVYSVDPDKRDADNFEMEVSTLSGPDAFDGNDVKYVDDKWKEQTVELGKYVKDQLLGYYDKPTVAGILLKANVIQDETGGNGIEGDSWFEWLDNGYQGLVDAFGGKDELKKAIDEYNKRDV